METQKTIHEKLVEAKQKVDFFEMKLQQEIGQLVNMASHSKLLASLKELAVRLIADRRALYALGGVVAGFLVIRLLFFSGGGNRRALPSARGMVVYNPQPSFFRQLITTSVQTFLLTYAKKLLTDYLSKGAKTKTAR